jgi:cytochrome P450
MSVTTDPILFDPSDPDLRRDPYPTYRKMRETAPAWQSPWGVWYFTRYDDCCDMFRSPAISYNVMASNAYQRQLSNDPDERERQLATARKNRSLLDSDPPEHTRLRALMNRAFTAPTIEANRSMIDDAVDSLLDQFDEGTVDVVSHLGDQLPALVLCGIMGISDDRRDEFKDLSAKQVRTMDPDVPVTRQIEALDRVHEYVANLVAIKRDHPGDDLTTRLIEASENGRLVSEEELVTNTAVLLVAGTETTTNLITNAIYRLLTHPGQLALLRSNPGLIGRCVEEAVRYDPSTQFMRPRTVIEQTELGGAGLQPGDAVVPVIAGANRDPEHFENPDVFDINRSVNRHLSFGVGHHVCIGASLARAEAQTAILQLFQRFPTVALADEEPTYRPNLQTRGFSRLPVTI